VADSPVPTTQSDAPGLVSIRRFATTEVAVVHSGSLYWNPHFADGQDWRPGAVQDAQGRAVLGINGMIAKTPDALVVIDPNSLGPEDSVATAELVAGPPIEAALAALDVDAGDVTHVVITHGHFDHFTALRQPRDGTTLRFSNAEHLFPAADMPPEGATGRHIDDVRDVIGVVEAAGRLRLVSGDVDVAPGVTLLAAPGESPGHQVVRLHCGQDRVYYLGDLVHFPVEVDHLDWVALNGRDLPTLVKSRRRIFGDPGKCRGTFVFTHSQFPGWGSIDETDSGGWSWRPA
jgi:glyoxylase-like metal-dependent hydrolase (beta-lactamase superfamily II)